MAPYKPDKSNLSTLRDKVVIVAGKHREILRDLWFVCSLLQAAWAALVEQWCKNSSATAAKCS